MKKLSADVKSYFNDYYFEFNFSFCSLKSINLSHSKMLFDSMHSACSLPYSKAAFYYRW